MEPCNAQRCHLCLPLACFEEAAGWSKNPLWHFGWLCQGAGHAEYILHMGVHGVKWLSVFSLGRPETFMAGELPAVATLVSSASPAQWWHCHLGFPACLSGAGSACSIYGAMSSSACRTARLQRATLRVGLGYIPVPWTGERKATM